MPPLRGISPRRVPLPAALICCASCEQRGAHLIRVPHEAPLQLPVVEDEREAVVVHEGAPMRSRVSPSRARSF